MYLGFECRLRINRSRIRVEIRARMPPTMAVMIKVTFLDLWACRGRNLDTVEVMTPGLISVSKPDTGIRIGPGILGSGEDHRVCE